MEQVKRQTKPKTKKQPIKKTRQSTIAGMKPKGPAKIGSKSKKSSSKKKK